MPRVRDLLAPLPPRKKPANKKTASVEPAVVYVDELLTTREAALLTNMSEGWYERKRWEKKGPPFRRRGRTIRYVKRELLAWWTEYQEGDFRPN